MASGTRLSWCQRALRRREAAQALQAVGGNDGAAALTARDDAAAQAELAALFPKPLNTPRRFADAMRMQSAKTLGKAMDVMSVLRGFKMKYRYISVRAFHPALLYFSAIHSDRHAELAWEVLKAHGGDVSPDVVAYSLRMKAHLGENSDAAKTVVGIYKEMKAGGVAPNVHVHRAVGVALVRDGHFKPAVEFAEAAFREAGRVDAALVHALVAHAPDLPAAEMLAHRFKLDPAHPAVAARLITACRKTGDVAAAEEALRRVERPSVHCYIELQLIHQDRGAWREVARLIEQARAAGVMEPDAAAHLRLLRAISAPYRWTLDAEGGVVDADDLRERTTAAVRCFEQALADCFATSAAHGAAVLVLAAAGGDAALADRVRAAVRGCGLPESPRFKDLYAAARRRGGACDAAPARSVSAHCERPVFRNP